MLQSSRLVVKLTLSSPKRVTVRTGAYRTGAGAILFSARFLDNGDVVNAEQGLPRCFSERSGPVTSENITFDSTAVVACTLTGPLSPKRGLKNDRIPVRTEFNGLSVPYCEDQTVQTVLLQFRSEWYTTRKKEKKKNRRTRELAGGSGHINDHIHKIWCAMALR